MSPIFDCRDEAQLLSGMRQARQAIGRGELVVLPTDTVYGVAADAFDAPGRRSACSTRRGAGASRRRPCSSPGSRRCARSSRRCPSRSSGSSRSSGRAASPSCCRRSRRCRGTSARRAAPSRCGCPRTASPSSCSRRPARSPSRAPTSPGMAAGDRRRGRARRCCGDSVAVYLDDGPSATGVAVDDHRRDEPRRRRPSRACACCARARSTATRLREVLGDLLEPDPEPERRRTAPREAVRLHDPLHRGRHLRRSSWAVWRLSLRYKLYPGIRERDVHKTPDAAPRRHRDVPRRAWRRSRSRRRIRSSRSSGRTRSTVVRDPGRDARSSCSSASPTTCGTSTG